MRIAVDLDDTIWDLLPAWLDFINKKHHSHIKETDITQWSMRECIKGLDSKDIYSPLYDKNLWKVVQPKPDAMVYLPYIQSLGHEIIFVTSSSPESFHYKMKYVFEKYFNMFNPNSVICAKNKSLIKADMLIDDAIHNIESFDGKKILFHTNANNGYENDSVYIAYNWAQIFKYIKETT